MAKNNNERKCAFGVFLDIVDNLQEINNKPIAQKSTAEDNNKKCPFCSKEIESIAKTCCYCGEAQT
jgi:hypothetical protein